jgi:hypothetical protein
MAKNFWESDDLIQPAKAEPLPWEADSIVKSAKAINLEAETKKYEEEVPFLQRITDPLKAGVAKIPGFLPGLEVSSIQKQINAIREGKGGPRDPVTGESLPFQPEEAEAAINMLQAQQAEAQKKYMAAQAESGKYRTRPSVAAVGDAKTAREAFDLFQVDPLGVMSSVSLESIPQIVPALVLGAVTRNPTVGALAMGSTSFGGELSSGVMEHFQDKGINIKDPVAVNKALNDPTLFAEAYNHALTRGSIIGPLDAASAGLASKMLVPKQVIKNQFAKEAVNIGVAQPVAQMISGGGGEALAQIATEGEITKYGQVLTEMAGEGPSSVLETAAFGGKQAYDRLRAGQPPVTPSVTTPGVSPVTPVTPEVVSQAVIRPEDIEEEGAPPVAPTPAPVAAAPAAIPEDNAKRIAELQAEFEQIDQAYATATPDQFAQLNARQGQIKNEIAALQSGAPVTPVTPTPTEKVKPKKEEMAPKATEVVTAPKAEAELTIPIVNDKNEPVGYTDVIQPDTMYVDSGEVFVKGKDKGFHIDDIKRNLPDSPTKTALLEKADKLLQDYYKTVTGLKQPSTPDFYLRSRSSAKNIPSLGTDAVLDSTNPEVIKNIKNILKDYKIESGQSVEGNYIDAVDADLRLKEEEIKSPPVSKKSVIPTAEIRLAPYDGGFVASSSYMGKTGGYASPISVFGKFYKTRQEAIDAEANRIRKQAQEENNTVALKWLDTISKPTKESQVDINKARQAEKKAAAEKEPERKLTLEEKSAFFEKQRINQQREYAEKAKNDVRTPLKEVTDTDIDVAIKALELAGTDVEMVDAALPYLKDLERAGLIKIKPGKRKSFTKTNAGYALDRSFFTMSYQEKRQAIKDFLEGKPVKPLPEPEEEPVKTQAEINRERQAEKKVAKGKEAKPATSDALEQLKQRLQSDNLINVVLSKDGKTFYASGSNQRDPSSLVKLDLTPEEFRKATELEKRVKEARGFTNVGNASDALRKYLTPAAERLVGAKVEEAKPEERQAEKKAVTKVVEKAPKPEAKAEVKAEKLPVVKAPPLNQEWAEFKQPLTEAKISVFADFNPERDAKEKLIFEQYQKFQSGDFPFTEVSFTGAEARKRANAANKERRAIYNEAVDEFLSREITVKAPTKNQPKLSIEGSVNAVPPPIAKKIKPIGKSIEDLKKALFLIAAPKNDPRTGLKGIYVEPNRLVVTDGHRMVLYSTNTGVDESVILDKDNNPIDFQYPKIDAVVGKIEDAKLDNAINAIALGDYARGIIKANKYIQSGRPPIALQIKESLQIKDRPMFFDANYIEDMTNLFRQFGYDEFVFGVNENGMLKAKSPDGKVTQIVMGIREDRYIFMPFNVKRGVPGTYIEEKAEDKTIDVEAVDITPAQVKLLTNQVGKLSDADIAALEEHYGVANYSSDFMKRIREDVVKYVNKGADAVDAAIRSIIAKLQAGLLSVAVVFNPATFQAPDFDIPRFIEETKTITAEAPKNADMSKIANKAYSISAPAFIKAKQAFFIADKPNGKIHLFDTDGKFLKSSDALYGKQAGDVLTAEAREMNIKDMKDIDKITPAGVFNLSVNPNPDYTGGYTLRFTDDKGDMGGVAIHAVYTGDVKENREAKLASKDPKDKKVSFGCINVDTSFFTGNIIPRIDKMENAGVVVIPDAQEQLDLFVKPTTEKVAAPAKEIKTAERTKIVGRETPYYNDFTSNLDESYFDKQIVKTREDKVTDYAQARAATRRITKKVAKYGSDIPLQRELNTLLEIEQDLKYYLDMTKPVRNTAQDFMARATKELADGNISPEVESFIRNAFEKNPALLQGLRLSVRSKKTEGRENGNFNPYTRLITLWKDGSGIDNPKTIRHELAHSLELMMTPDTKKVLVDQWARALENAMKENVDEASKKYFDAVLNFLENPSKETFDAATKVMPSYDYYQYMNPSEYWAVNAEAMLGAKLGGPWLRFVNGLKKLLEGLKSFFGMDNRFVVHQVMDKLLSGEGKRLNQEGLTDYLFKGKYKIDFLNNMQEDVDLLKKYNIPSTPKTGLYNFKDKLIDSYKDFRNFKDALVATPVESTNKMIGSANDTLLFHRNKNVYFGQALESRDIKRYNGQLVNDQKIAIASVSLLNAVHSGHIFTEVAVLGKMEFNPKTQMYVAAKADYSLANILKAQDKLFKKLGKQIGADIINAWFEAKRVRSIFDEFLKREANLQEAIDAGEKVEDAQRDYDNIRVAYDKIPEYFLVKDEDGNFVTQEIRNDEGEVVDEIRVINDDAVYEISQLEEKHPELRVMMDNWTKVNHNALDNAIHSGLISKTRGAQLKEIKDYVPWQRIRDDMDDVHSPGLGVAGLTNLAKERRFKKGFVESKIDDIVHNMMVNTMMLNRNSVRNHAGNAIAKEYATRGENGKIKTYPKEGVTQEGYIRANIIINGRRVIVEFRDPLVAEAVLGMESMDIPMIGALGFFAQGLRRGITSNPLFQIFQVFKDAPQAAAVTNINGKGAFSNITNPMSIYFGTLNSFFMALNPNDEIVKILKSYGIGGYQSSYRTPEKELALKMGLQTRSLWSGFLKVLDHIGDAADYAQRRSIYKRVLKETGNEMLAIVQANNVIDFLKHGSGKLAIASIRTTSFMNAYAQNMNTLATAMAGGGLKGMERKKAAALFYKTTGLFVATTLIYCFLKGGDDEYDKLDDQTKYRNYIIGDVKIPVMTSYSFFYKTMVEALYYKITRAATENEMDYKRLVKGLQKAAADALLSPNLIPTGAKPVIEIALDRNFFTGGTITPRGMENLESFQQWTAATSNLGKIISAGTGGVLNPIEADHLIRGLTGTAGVLAMSASDLFTSDKPAKTASQNPLFGPYVLAPEPRLREDLFYTFKEESDRVYDTWVKMQKRQMKGDAKQYFEENKDLIKSHGYVAKAESMLKKINGEIRRIGELPAEKMSPEEKRERITELQSTKNKVLKGVIDQRIKAGMNKYPWED